LKKNPTNPFIKSKLLSESKEYKKLRKQKQKEFIDSLYHELDQLHKNNPKGYMNIINSIRDGSFDKSVKDDTGHVSPDKWREHFQRLLGPPVDRRQDLHDYISENCDLYSSELDRPFSVSEFSAAVKSLKNNKAPAFDRVSNEMLKIAHPIAGRQLLFIFNAVLATGKVPSIWKDNILTPIHKSGSLTDPDNYRGIAVGSCVCKLFSKLLNKRLEIKANTDNMVSPEQGSGKCGSRTADHLLVVKFLIDKYVNIQGGKLFACFVDLRKCFDTIPRDLLFYSLLKNHSIGGQFLKVIKEIYDKNQLFVKVSEGLCQSFVTTKGVLQGEINSPLLFNIFVDKITKVFDESCDPVFLNNTPQNCLLWSDDLAIFSTTARGLQNSIDKMCLFYASLGLEISLKKTKIIIFNKSGKLLRGYNFVCNGTALEVTNEYQYLGIKFTPSGSMTLATNELCAKASRAWFSISNIIYTNKRMPVKRAMELFDSLVTPVALYASEFWLPSLMQKICFSSVENMFSFWESLKCETINQRFCRMLLSVHGKASRLAVLGELGRYPLFVRALQHCLAYKHSLASKPRDSPVALAMAEMAVWTGQGKDCWLGRVETIGHLLKVPRPNQWSTGKVFGRQIKSRFDRFWLDQINFEKPGSDGNNHNKLRTYSRFKASFTIEPYVECINNRNQRSDLTRLRVSAHGLGIERLRYTRPPIPPAQRGCRFCGPPGPRVAIGSPGRGPVDDEQHAITACGLMAEEREQMYREMSDMCPTFGSLCCQDKFVRLLCPVNPVEGKIVNRFLSKTFAKRKDIDEN
jgi:hypothetical protein